MIWSLFSIKQGQKVRFLAVLIYLSCPSFATAQTTNEGDGRDLISLIVEEYIESIGEDAELDFNTISEQLYIVYKSPYNINKVTRQELEDLVIFTDSEINGFLDYRTNFGPFLSLYELQAIPGLTIEKTNVLRHILTFEELNSKQGLNKTQALISDRDLQLYVKWRRRIETVKGFQPQSSNGEIPFRGDPNYLYSRMVYKAGNKRAGFTIEKDVGERFTNPNALTGLDFLSFHYEVTNPEPWINQLNIGDFAVNMGQGLIAHNSFGIGKSSFSTSTKRGGKPIKAYTSVAENLNFRGIAGDFKINKQFSALGFLSSDRRDANVIFDQNDEATEFSSLQLSGLHRTQSEIDDADGIVLTTTGGNLRWDQDKVHIGFNTIHNFFSLPRGTSSRLDRINNWSGDRLSNYSLDYSMLVDGWNLYGEIAYTSTGGWAQQYGLLKTLDPSFDISVIYRDYDEDYTALAANSFGESNIVNNEKGLYFGWEYRMSKQWKLRGYADFWSNPWTRSRVDGKGTGNEYLLRIDFKEKRKRNYYLLFRHERKDENASSASIIDRPIARTIQRLRLHASHNISQDIELRSRVEMSFYHKEEVTEKGFLAYQDILYKPTNADLSFSARLAYFNTTSFNTRIFAYESDLLYEYYVPSFWGEGIRTYLNLRYNWNYHLMTEIRIEHTNFRNQETISSGFNEIKGSHTSRIKAQIRYRF